MKIFSRQEGVGEQRRVRSRRVLSVLIHEARVQHDRLILLHSSLLWCEALLFSRKSSNLARKTAVYD